MALASSGNYYNAQQLLHPLLSNSKWVFKTKQSIKNVSKIIKNSRVISNNLLPFKKSVGASYGTRYGEALVSYASLYFNIERFSVVISLLEGYLNSIPMGQTKDDAIWLYLLSLSHTDTSRIINRLDFYIGQLSEQKYVTGIIDHVITSLVQGAHWNSIVDIAKITQEYGDLESQSRILWILSRLYRHDYIYVENKENRIEELLDKIVTMDSSSYYSYIANALLKRESNLALQDPAPKSKLNDNDIWIQGFLKYGLEDEAILFSKQVKDLNYSVAMETANITSDEGKHLEAIRFLNRHSVPLNTESYSIYYPLPYKDIIKDVSKRYGIPETMFSGLIRTESGFDMDVVSGAGAVGLSQLMPATAREQANNLGIENHDLNDPGTNILLGGSYLKWLIGKYDSFAISCLAYNAGPGNVWEWQGRWGALPDELFLEAAPFRETRAYVPQILKAAIFYGHKEFNVTPHNVVKAIFPNID